MRTAVEMRDQVMENLPAAGIVIKAAAVADFHLSKVPDQKVKKTAARISLELDPTPDILAELGRKKGDRLLVGFAAETQNLQQEARRKLESKNCDMVVGNLVGGSGTGFRVRRERSGAGAAHRRDHSRCRAPPNACIADRIFDEVLNLRLALHAAQWTLNDLRQYLEFYQDLGIKTLYRQAPRRAGSPAAPRRSRPSPQAASIAMELPPPRTRQTIRCSRSSRTSAIAAAAACTRAATRSSSASGNEQSPLVFVGEGPGADEDAQGIPFVGRAGQLLTQMIEGTAKKEGIDLLRNGHLHLQRGEVPSAGEPHAGAGRDGDLRPVPAPAA